MSDAAELTTIIFCSTEEERQQSCFGEDDRAKEFFCLHDERGAFDFAGPANAIWDIRRCQTSFSFAGFYEFYANSFVIDSDFMFIFASSRQGLEGQIFSLSLLIGTNCLLWWGLWGSDVRMLFDNNRRKCSVNYLCGLTKSIKVSADDIEAIFCNFLQIIISRIRFVLMKRHKIYYQKYDKNFMFWERFPP